LFYLRGLLEKEMMAGERAHHFEVFEKLQCGYDPIVVDEGSIQS
jgi:hypothetical protein